MVTSVTRSGSLRHKSHLLFEEIEEYPITRGLNDIARGNNLGFDVINHLARAIEERGSPLEVLDGGSGAALALADIKNAFGNQVRTTAATLNPAHLRLMQQLPEGLRPDEVVIGPIEYHAFTRQYDFILDYLGAAFYFPGEVLPVYGRVLRPRGRAYVRLPLYDHVVSDRIGLNGGKFEAAKDLLRECGLEIELFKKDFADLGALLRRIDKNATTGN